MFFIDDIVEKSYDDLIQDLNDLNHVPYLVKNNNTYQVYLLIIAAILEKKSILLLDGDLNIEDFSYQSDVVKSPSEFQISLKDKQELLNIIKDNLKSNSYGIELLTSGTTGKPKVIFQPMANLSRNVKFKENEIWGVCYNPTHMAGIQVFLQALYNGSTILNLFESNKVEQLIEKYKVTTLTMTPTFFKNHFSIKNSFEYIIGVSFGGEKLSESVKKRATNVFPKAVIRNIYASTEAGSLLLTKGDYFIIPDKLKEKVVVHNNTLKIHKSLLGDVKCESDWYDSGDIVEVSKKFPNQFKFIYRDSDIINVGGYNVNPVEIEELIGQFKGVKDCTVYGSSNSVLGKIVACDIVTTERTENLKTYKKELKKYLLSNLQEWKLPIKYNFVEKINKTKTGKKKRV